LDSFHFDVLSRIWFGCFQDIRKSFILGAEGREKLADTAFDLRIFGWVDNVHRL